MQISCRVYLLASGHLGCSFSHPNDCNVYALRCGSRYFLIDTGVGLGTDRILSELESGKIQPAQAEGILLTHGHLDHSGGARSMDCIPDKVYGPSVIARDIWNRVFDLSTSYCFRPI
jgi:glyoxylase-like metal-dependent hydrolase (beta-lactamase superfamily II)